MEAASAPRIGVPAQPAEATTDEAFGLLLLAALADMARRSKRRQADLTVAMHRAGLPLDATRVRAALRWLLAQGCIESLVPLCDGGLLLSVTTGGIERLGGGTPWLLPLGIEA